MPDPARDSAFPLQLGCPCLSTERLNRDRLFFERLFAVGRLPLKASRFFPPDVPEDDDPLQSRIPIVRLACFFLDCPPRIFRLRSAVSRGDVVLASTLDQPIPSASAFCRMLAMSTSFFHGYYIVKLWYARCRICFEERFFFFSQPPPRGHSDSLAS